MILCKIWIRVLLENLAYFSFLQEESGNTTTVFRIPS